MPTALIAEDEPLLAEALRAELATAWPELRVLATAADGLSAVRLALDLQPDVLFFDIRMPGQSGLDAAAELADAWPAQGGKPFPALVFVTAYDQYALAAFDAQAVDYLVKPVQRERLEKCIKKLALAHKPIDFVATESENSAQTATDTAAPDGPPAPVNTLPTAQQLQQLAALTHWLTRHAPPPTVQRAGPAVPRLRVVQASAATGTGLVMVPVDEVLVFEAADKYLRVLTADQDLLIRTPLKDLLPQLDPGRFWQIHRGTVVRADAVARATRDDAGRLWLHLHPRHQRPERLAVSRVYAHLFKAM